MNYKELDEVHEVVDNLIKQYIYDFKFERINLCFFKRNYYKCTKKQLDFLKYLLNRNVDYELSEKQLKYLSKFSVKEISSLISAVKDIELIYHTSYIKEDGKFSTYYELNL